MRAWPRCRGLLPVLLLLAGSAAAGEVKIVFVHLARSQDGSWHIDTTLRHADSGWDHYADAWRVVDAGGRVLGTRTLLHPHVDEQPFTRSLSGIDFDGATRVYLEARDSVHGWAGERVEIDLARDAGGKYRVER